MKRSLIMLALAALALSSTVHAAPSPSAAVTPPPENEALGATYVNAVKHDSPWRMCRDFVAGQRDRSCRVKRLPFAAAGAFHGLYELRKFDGEASYSTLAVAGPRGVVEAQFSYRVDDPTFPGCPSIVLPLALERAYVEDGHLVVISVGDVVGYVDPSPHIPLDTGARSHLVRNVVILSWVDEGLRTKDYTNAFSPRFGFKVNRPWGSMVPWHTLPWNDRSRPKVIDGHLIDPR